MSFLRHNPLSTIIINRKYFKGIVYQSTWCVGNFLFSINAYLAAIGFDKKEEFNLARISMDRKKNQINSIYLQCSIGGYCTELGLEYL